MRITIVPQKKSEIDLDQNLEKRECKNSRKNYS